MGVKRIEHLCKADIWTSPKGVQILRRRKHQLGSQKEITSKEAIQKHKDRQEQRKSNDTEIVKQRKREGATTFTVITLAVIRRVLSSLSRVLQLLLSFLCLCLSQWLLLFVTLLLLFALLLIW